MLCAGLCSIAGALHTWAALALAQVLLRTLGAGLVSQVATGLLGLEVVAMALCIATAKQSWKARAALVEAAAQPGGAAAAKRADPKPFFELNPAAQAAAAAAATARAVAVDVGGLGEGGAGSGSKEEEDDYSEESEEEGDGEEESGAEAEPAAVSVNAAAGRAARGSMGSRMAPPPQPKAGGAVGAAAFVDCAWADQAGDGELELDLEGGEGEDPFWGNDDDGGDLVAE